MRVIGGDSVSVLLLFEVIAYCRVQGFRVLLVSALGSLSHFFLDELDFLVDLADFVDAAV